ncbi:hypothetical protein GQ55_8G006400 [Panicum hallii var. hallii]|uniref:Uncharacterized protein n=1 Tax=Panicum hallii var. hallii TaxID=1504633 RepID=A0A2T7CJI1_9POAL|nr:hypothetical protein GQ55_8G006400 [Panicum hallii var. hallii]
MQIVICHLLATKYILRNLSSIMDARYVALCFFLVLVLHGNPTLAETCRQFVKVHPFCFKAYCKANCFIQGKYTDGSYVKGYRCEGNIFQSVCVCLLCKH